MIKIIILSECADENSRNLLRGITSYSNDHGFWTVCKMPAYYRETIGIEGILLWAKEWGADGILGQFLRSDEVQNFTQAKIPVIALDFKERFCDIPNVTGDYWETGRMGAEYFLKKGFKHFAFYGINNTVWSDERAEGFTTRLQDVGFRVHYFGHQHSDANDLWHHDQSALTVWLDSLPKPIALMACNDEHGHHIIEAARHAGIQVPDEMAVLGVGNDEMVCNLSYPRMSSIELDAVKCGYEAARLMEQMIHSKSYSASDIVHKPTQVISRCSTDIFASEDKYIVAALKYIHENLDKNLSVDQVLREVPLSRRSLEKRFVLTTGLPVYEYIYNQRIERFTQKLLETDMTISEIAFKLGLNDSKNIARQFKQIKGLTPMEYRKMHLLTAPARVG